MTRDKKRKAAVRATQAATGERYVRAARASAGPVNGPVDGKTDGPERGRVESVFALRELLGECATLPPVEVDWGWDPDFGGGPDVFYSQLLGAAIPFGTVLELAGQLAREGRGVELCLEALSPLGSAVVSAGQRRFNLIISQDSVYELCGKPRCSSTPEDELIPWCREHLAECTPDALVAMAEDWGYAQSDGSDDDLTARGGAEEAVALIRAAVTQGVYERVLAKLLDACFDSEDVIDERAFWDAERALAIRQAIERERLRLEQAAAAEYRRIQKETGACAVCGKGFRFGIDMAVPAQYCSPGCVPPPPATAVPDPEPW
ncbi:hypothetical protein [Streptomyces sp. NPDC047985]|uniref:hypothetical protein n=1 Tax=Streptomyces sp. NPDC047985 TaxID=3155384 RepID=UPI00343CAEFF